MSGHTGGRSIRRTSLAATGALLIGASGLGLGLALGGEDHEGAPPPAPPVTVAVERRTLVDAVELECATSFATVDLPTPSASDHGDVVVTSSRAAAGPVPAGTVLLEISGRPLVVLPGAFPLYRDLHRGDQGADVKELQRALSTIGIYAGAVDGDFGATTEQALRALYTRIGYRVPTEEVTPEAPTGAVAATPPTAVASGAASPTSPAPDPAPAPAPLRKVWVPRAEIALLPSMPATLEGDLPAVGTRPAGALARFRTGAPRLTCTGSRLDELTEGQDLAPGPGAPQGLVVRELHASQPSGEGAGGGSSATPSDAGTPSAPAAASPSRAGVVGGESPAVLVGPRNGGILSSTPPARFTLTARLAGSDGPALVVPVAAVGGTGSGAFVTVLASGAERRIAVTLGPSIDGWTVVTSGDLKEGDQVVIAGGHHG